MMPKLWLTYALRNLRSGLRGFWIFLSCITLGVAAIAMIGSLASAVQQGLDEQGQTILGGDVEFSIVQREATVDEKAYFASRGTLSATATMRAMAQGAGTSTLVELKAIDGAYPLFGTLKLSPAVSVTATENTIAVDPLLLQRLNLKLGDSLKIGQASLTIAATIVEEPDRLANGIIFGPRVILSTATLAKTGLIQPGSLVNYNYHVKLPGAANAAAGNRMIEEAKAKFPQAGWKTRATDKAAQGADEFVGRLSYFMTLVSIAALAIGGAGIATAVAAFINRRREAIATLKCLGLPNHHVVAISLTEIMLVGTLGIALALCLGAATPFVVKAAFGSILPLPVATAIMWRPLGFAAVLGFLITMAFALIPLARISQIKGAALFRAHSMDEGGARDKIFIAAALGLLALSAIVILLSFEDKRVTASYLGGLVVSFAVLALLANLIVKGASLLPRSNNLLLRQAIGSLYKPGATARAVIMALGLGLTLFVTLALTDQTLSNELKSSLPERAPAFFFIDVPNTERDNFEAKLKTMPGVTTLTNAPMLRGRITKVKGVAAEQVKPGADASWALRGDRGLTYATDLPTGSTLVEGKWWPKDYHGPNLVSMTKDIAEGLDLKIGDKITVNVLGRDVEAEIANLRTVNWRAMGINFVLVFTPDTLKAAPHSEIVTVEMKGGDEGQVLNTMAAAYPAVTAIRVKDALNTVGSLLEKMLLAVRGANIITLLTGVLVLAGALAAGLSARSYEAVVLKTYGATRSQLLSAFVIEYAVLGLVAAAFGIVTGTAASWFLAHYILDMTWSFSFATALVTALIAMVITICAGLSVTARALSAKPSFYLRNES
ncbi:MAG: FtsX-like permease family protein [Alphaproteobacteria bacterium]|nr:FtsX-like permease family protein [Alphaproteobacteria bacterium]